MRFRGLRKIRHRAGTMSAEIADTAVFVEPVSILNLHYLISCIVCTNLIVRLGWHLFEFIYKKKKCVGKKWRLQCDDIDCAMMKNFLSPTSPILFKVLGTWLVILANFYFKLLELYGSNYDFSLKEIRFSVMLTIFVLFNLS